MKLVLSFGFLVILVLQFAQTGKNKRLCASFLKRKHLKITFI